MPYVPRGVELITLFTSFIPAIIQYVLIAFAIYTIAKRRRIIKPWLAWIPVANAYPLGALTDQLNARAGRKTNWRIILVWLTAITVALSIITFVLTIALVAQAENYSNGYGYNYNSQMLALSGSILWLTFASVAVSIVAIGLMVCEFICYYRLFESCRPGKETLYVLLGLFVPFALPICVFICRNYENGMPVPVGVSSQYGPSGAPAQSYMPSAPVQGYTPVTNVPPQAIENMPPAGVIPAANPLYNQQAAAEAQKVAAAPIERSGPVGTTTGFTVAPGQVASYGDILPKRPSNIDLSRAEEIAAKYAEGPSVKAAAPVVEETIEALTAEETKEEPAETPDVQVEEPVEKTEQNDKTE